MIARTLSAGEMCTRNRVLADAGMRLDEAASEGHAVLEPSPGRA